ncbi:hypothetical protein ALCH109712_13625 [Alkalicoccus chagannorensis]
MNLLFIAAGAAASAGVLYFLGKSGLRMDGTEK